jgi:hypothetical protein
VRHVIKKILKEEEGLDWIKETNPTDEIVSFTEQKLGESPSGRRTLSNLSEKNRRLYQLFDTWHSAMTFLITDTDELSQFAENVNDDNWSADERLDALNMMEDYLNMGSMIEDTRRALTFFKPLLEQKNYTLTDILTTLTEHYNK